MGTTLTHPSTTTAAKYDVVFLPSQGFYVIEKDGVAVLNREARTWYFKTRSIARKQLTRLRSGDRSR